jgi:hypothetical protein
MEHGVDAPLCGKFQSIIDSGHHLDYFKWPVSSGCKFGGGLVDTEILSF